MIGPGWAEDRDKPRATEGGSVRKIAIVTGTRAEYGLLRPVMHAVQERSDLELMILATGSHMIQPAITYREIKQEFHVTDSIPMQTAGRVGRWADVDSVGKGISRFGRSFERLRPDIVVVLGDRIEAFAAASAACIGGVPIAHIHGGDLAEGVADEAMRHAITKLANIHFPATETSAARITRMGEPAKSIHVSGSPAIDGLNAFEGMSDDAANELGDPECVFLMHPIGRPDEQEEAVAAAALEAIGDRRTLCLMPNLDPGRVGIVRAIEAAADSDQISKRDHLKRDEFVSLLKRLASTGGVLVGNSSAGMIEAGALGVPVVNIGTRQSGRERGTNAIDASGENAAAIAKAIDKAANLDRSQFTHPFGDGSAAPKIAKALAGVNLADPSLLRKHFAEA
jgi:UDP-hydrolysing UDP-N-acetyl-D-glucosamine 2-epimerase